MNFGIRLSEERKRMSLNQTDFGKIGGVTKTSQINYESGERKPNVDYLQAISAAGVDVQYILTGKRAVLTGEGEMLKTKPDPTPTSSTEDRRCGISDRRLTMMDELLDGLDQTQQQEILSVISEKKRINEMQRQLEQLINQQTRQSA